MSFFFKRCGVSDLGVKIGDVWCDWIGGRVRQGGGEFGKGARCVKKGEGGVK